MRVGGRIAAAIEILQTLEAQRRPVGHVLKEWGHAHRFAGSGDRAAIANLVYDALRYRRSVAAQMDDASARAAIIAVVHMQPAYLNGTPLDFTGDRHAPASLSETEQARLSAQAHDMAPDVQADCPSWLWDKMQRVFGDDAVTQVAAMAARAPLDLRLNPFRSQTPRVEKALARYKPESDPAFPMLRRIPAAEGFARAVHVASDEAYQKGWIEVQDAGSQLAAELAVGNAKPRTVLDLCAGAGGKSLALAVFMQGKGQVFAHDIDRRRMADLWPRVKRAGVHNIQVIDPDALGNHDLTQHGADCVVVDAPCTGTGTWRRHPDTKWRVTDKALSDRTKDQDSVLRQAAKCVKPGGRVAYITCSVLAEENEDRLEAFLADHPDFTAMPAEEMMASLARQALPSHLPSIKTELHDVGALGLRLTPQTSGTDGFFVANLIRGAQE